MSEQETQRDIENLTRRVESMESELVGRSTTTLETLRSVKSFRPKPDSFADGNWEEWLNHFMLCAEINKWDDEQKCQIFAVSLRGRAQTIYLALKNEDKNDFKRLVEAMERMMNPERGRMAHKLAFRQRKREKGESLIDLVTNLRKLAHRAHPGKDAVFVEEEILDQFIAALDSRELRIGVSQTNPKSVDEGLTTALRLESLFLVEKKQQHNLTANMTDQGDQNVYFTGTSADVNAVGSDITPPTWAQAFFDQQTRLMEKLIGATKSNGHNPVNHRPSKKNVKCYNCGEFGHYRRECNKDGVQGNASRAGLPRM